MISSTLACPIMAGFIAALSAPLTLQQSMLLLPDVGAGTTTTERRALAAVEWCRQVTRAALAHAGLHARAAKVADLSPVVDAKTARAATDAFGKSTLEADVVTLTRAIDGGELHAAAGRASFVTEHAFLAAALAERICYVGHGSTIAGMAENLGSAVGAVAKHASNQEYMDFITTMRSL
jgi:hypothetical protein